MNLPAAIFFDWDGTLVDSFKFLNDAHNHVRGIFGDAPMSADMFRGYFGKPRDALYAELYQGRHDEARGHFEAYVLAHHAAALKPMPGAEDVLKVLARRGLPSGIVTNKKGIYVRREVAQFGWDSHFRAVVGAGEAEADKPSAAPLIMAIERAGLAAEARADIWYVGDTETDAQCAAGAGCPFILIDHNRDAAGWIGGYKPLLQFDDCVEFAGFLQKI